jgi:hypothetical protein
MGGVSWHEQIINRSIGGDCQEKLTLEGINRILNT